MQIEILMLPQGPTLPLKCAAVALVGARFLKADLHYQQRFASNDRCFEAQGVVHQARGYQTIVVTGGVGWGAEMDPQDAAGS